MTYESWIEQGALSIRTERDPAQVYVVEFYGELVLAGIEVAAKELRHSEQTDAEEIIVDLSGLELHRLEWLASPPRDLCERVPKPATGSSFCVVPSPSSE